jgi:hypothetical protein
MIMEVQYQSKEESNKKQLESFLKLTKAERFYSFLNLVYKVNQFPTKKATSKSSNFLIVINTK